MYYHLPPSLLSILIISLPSFFQPTHRLRHPHLSTSTVFFLLVSIKKMKLILFFLPLVVSLLPSWDVILAKQKKISQIIDKTLKEIKIPYSKRHIVENESYIQNFCPNDIYHNMSACCSAQELFNLYNVKIEKGKFIGYSSTPHRPIHLPTIASLQYNAKPTYTNTFTIRNGSFGHQQCSKYFNGTLHITGEQTVHKLYHASKMSPFPAFNWYSNRQLYSSGFSYPYGRLVES